MPQPVLTPEAEVDLDHAFDWYEEQRPGLGEDFLSSVQDLLDRLVENPRLYQELEQGIRRALTRRFPYALFYLLENGQVVVLAALHQSRDPEHWKSRI